MKFIALILALVLSVSALAGCDARRGKVNTSPTATASPKVTEKVTTDAPMDGENAASPDAPAEESSEKPEGSGITQPPVNTPEADTKG